MLQSLLLRWPRRCPTLASFVALATWVYPAAAWTLATPVTNAGSCADDEQNPLQLHPTVCRNIQAAAEGALEEAADAWAAEQAFVEAWSARPVQVVPLETSRRGLCLRIVAEAEARTWAQPVQAQSGPEVTMLADEAVLDGHAGARLAAQCAILGRRSMPPAGYRVHAEVVGAPRRVWAIGYWPLRAARHEQACAVHFTLDPDCLRALGDPAACGYTQQRTLLEISQDVACDEVETHWRCRQLGERRTPDLSGDVEAIISQGGR